MCGWQQVRGQEKRLGLGLSQDCGDVGGFLRAGSGSGQGVVLGSEEGGTCRFITLEEGQNSTEEEGVGSWIRAEALSYIFGKCERKGNPSKGPRPDLSSKDSTSSSSAVDRLFELKSKQVICQHRTTGAEIRAEEDQRNWRLNHKLFLSLSSSCQTWALTNTERINSFQSDVSMEFWHVNHRVLSFQRATSVHWELS